MAQNKFLEIRDLKVYIKFVNNSIPGLVTEKTPRIATKNPLNNAQNNAEQFLMDNKLIDGINYEDIPVSSKELRLVDGVNLNIYEGESVSIIGETGCGKSTLLMSIFSSPLPYSYKSGDLFYYLPDNKYVNLLQLDEEQLQKLRDFHFGLIPQLPQESMTAWLAINAQTGPILSEHLSQRQEKIKEKAIEFFGISSFPPPKTNISKYVARLSRGEAQRLNVVLGLMKDPKLVLSDEIFSSLDPIMQNQVIELLRELKDDLGIQFLFTTHNVGAAAQLSSKIAIMYAGEIVEITTVEKFFDEPLHPYSQGILGAIPWYVMRKNLELKEIFGELPAPNNWPKGCKFHPRCPKAKSKCSQQAPPRYQIDDTRVVECWLYE